MSTRCDVIIVGSGIAGLYAALRLDSSLDIMILTKESIEQTNTYLAQGGIAASIHQKDSPQSHFEDTLRAGAEICDVEALRVMVDEASSNINNLLYLGVDFDLENGQIALTMEGGHSRPRILHINGDTTGKGILNTLFDNVKNRSNIQIRENSFCTNLIVKDNCCRGVYALEGSQLKSYAAKAVILATGGIGTVYGVTTNAVVATGDAIAIGKRAGVEIADMEFIQFHPTVFYNNEDKKRFLISEAVRGEGGILRNKYGERFMDDYDDRMELAPRDIVARAIFSEMEETDTNHVYLDITHLDSEFIMKRFPGITATCLKYGVDITTELIPVAPAQHYCMGGLKIDIFARTSLSGLYACGEVACSGVHGANRLASNSLLESLVFANRAASDVNSVQENIETCKDNQEIINVEVTKTCDVSKEKEIIQNTMRRYAGIIRSEAGLKKCYRILNELEKSLTEKECINKDYMECVNMLTTAEIITEAALKRKESIGAHFLISDKGESRHE